MNGSTSLILFITLLIVTMGGIGAFYGITNAMKDAPGQMQVQEDDNNPELTFVNIVGTNIENETYKYVQVQVAYTGDEPLNINDTFIQLRTGSSIADLQYRNGTPTRSEENGFYTG